MILARRRELLKESGRQMAYHRSTAIAAKVNTETDTETV